MTSRFPAPLARRPHMSPLTNGVPTMTSDINCPASSAIAAHALETVAFLTG